VSAYGSTLRRSVADRQIAGVCAGIGEYFSIDPTVVRVAFAVGALPSLSAIFWLYVILWCVIPEREYY